MGKNPRNLGFINVGLQGKDAADLQKAQDLLLQFSEKFLQLTPVERFPDGPAISIVVPEEETVGALAQYLVMQGQATVISFSQKVPRHIGFGHAVLVANISIQQLLLNGGARVTNLADVVQVGVHAAESSIKATVHEGIVLELRLVNPARVADMLRQKGVSVGQVGWIKAAVAALQGRRTSHGVGQAAPANISAGAQLLYQCVRGRAEVVAVETYLEWMDIQPSKMLLRILRGQIDVSKGRVPRLTALQANAEAGSTMHVGVVRALIASAWGRLRSEVIQALVAVRVHASCAGVINAGFLAVVAALGDYPVELVVATECVEWRRTALRLQYPRALLYADACEPLAFAVGVEVLVLSWPCMPYSAANHVPKGAIARFRHQARLNTEIAVRVIRLAAAATPPPLIMVMENVPGLVERSIYEDCRAMLVAAMSVAGYLWQDGVLCPAELRMGPQMRRRWYGVGVRQDAC